MICYKDKCFCPYYKDCRFQDECDRPLTDKVKQDAFAFGLPIDEFMSIPECYEKERKNND